MGIPRNKASKGDRSRSRKRKASETLGSASDARPPRASKTASSEALRNRSAEPVSLKTDAVTEEEGAFRRQDDGDEDGQKKERKKGSGVRAGVGFEGGESRAEEEVLFEQRYYDILERVCVPEPMLSFDFVRDGGGHSLMGVKDSGSGDARKRRMLKIVTMCGFQFQNPFGSTVSLTKMNNLRMEARNTVEDSDSSDEDGDSDEQDENEEENLRGMFKSRTIEERSVNFAQPVNRLRTNPFNTSIVAAWTASDGLSIIDTSQLLKSLNKRPTTEVKVPEQEKKEEVLFKYAKHQGDCFALDWSRVVKGRLATGMGNGSLCVLDPSDESASSWIAGSMFENAHKGSVEDVKWSPGEKNVFASGGVDRSIKFWDVRSTPYKSVASIPNAHTSDVNALSWNAYEQHLVLSGGDEGTIKVWDLRMIAKNKTGTKENKPVGDLRFHQKAIGCLEWHPHDVSMFVACSWDDSVTIWDLSCERDVDVELAKGMGDSGNDGVPPQLLFTHKSKGSVTECHWHPVYDSVVVTSSDSGMDIFKPSNVKSAK
eukprot:Plantae.Rhodophyta-Hildenbrandia_rubra.ctg10474.p2 GENE.Plantae.Rhodophyta-Hildenbrandia_rubra.ctg10474~~Plantae.Rhodophyta-Hildenbrandia_rubra.ctg10474.p2  ORF type:complete len:541 (-),score=115.99 Plantae.Rhodophyta-Hildenbrandia_rubra.ctg10474:3483-5105(-)